MSQGKHPETLKVCKEEGRQEGINKRIELLLSIGMSMEETKEKVMQAYDLPEQEIDMHLERFFDKK